MLWVIKHLYLLETESTLTFEINIIFTATAISNLGGLRLKLSVNEVCPHKDVV